MDKAIAYLYLAGITLAGLLLLTALAVPLFAVISAMVTPTPPSCSESAVLLPVEADVALCASGARVSWRRVDEGYLVTCRCDTLVKERPED